MNKLALLAFSKKMADGFERGYQDGYADALSKRTDLVVTANGEYAPSEGSTGFKSVSVNVVSNVAKKIVDGTITELTVEDLQGITAIRQYAFYYNSSLKKIAIPNGVTKIDNRAFYHCSNLTNLSLPKSLLKIQTQAFYECTNLSSLALEDNSELTYIGTGAFYKCPITNFTIPRGVEVLESDAFSDCSALTSVDISEDSALTSIGSNAFYRCSNLTKITIPSLVKIIGGNAFGDCSALKRIVLKRVIPTSIQSNTFRNIPADCVFVVPYGYGERYKSSTNWSAYADQIIEGDE